MMLAAAGIIVASAWRIFERLGAEGWESLIPVYNAYRFTQLLDYSPWTFLLLFIPGVNLLVLMLLMTAAAGRLGVPRWWGVMMALPLVNLFFLPAAAFSAELHDSGPGEPPRPEHFRVTRNADGEWVEELSAEEWERGSDRS
jgi:hypothetical protein